MMNVIRYDSSMSEQWDDFVRNSANGTMLHMRGYMDYHSHRFSDCSLLVMDKRNRIVGILPANSVGHTLYSHQGLTYGGWIMPLRHFAPGDMLYAWECMAEWMRGNGFSELVYKPIPHIYHSYPAEDDLYALFRLGATIDSVQVSSAIPIGQQWLGSQTVRWEVRKVAKSDVTIAVSDDYTAFFSILQQRLSERYDAVPVHSVDEMVMLANRFPERIKLIVALNAQGSLLAGTVIYKMPTVVHTQYIATTSEARRQGIFPAIVEYILRNECHGRKWFEFGTSCEQHGLILNRGLSDQKYHLGGRSVIYASYRLNL